MSAKHHQRTRAEILAKRRAEDALRPFARAKGRHKHVSKYMPHTGAKEAERAKRLRMDFLHGPHAVYSDNERSAPTLCQLSKADHEQQSWQREYDSVF